MHARTALILCTALLASCAATPPPAVDPPAAAPRSIHDKLARRIDLRLERVELRKALDWFRDTVDVNLVVNEASLQKAGVAMSEPVELHLTQVRARRAIELILNHVSGPLAKPLAAEVDGQVVRIAAREDLRDLAVVRVHDMTEIVDQPVLRWAVIDAQRPVIGLSPPMEITTRPTRQEIIEQLTTLVQDVCGDATDWEFNGGEIGSLREKRSRMTIKALPSTHADVDRLIFLLDRAARNAALRQEREKEIVMRLNKANALRLREQYDAALAETDKALAVFADHNIALAMKQLLLAARRRASAQAGPSSESSQSPEPAYPFDHDYEREPDDDALAQEQLDRLISVDFRSVTIREAMAEIAAKARTNIYANWKVLDAVGITPDLRVDLRLRGVPAGQALSLALEQTDNQLEEDKLTFQIVKGVAVVSSASGARLNTTYEVYDIREIIAWPLDPLGLQALEAEPGVAGERDPSEEPVTREAMIEAVISMLQDQVGVQSEWAAYGGEVNIARELNGNLIIKARPADHARILELLGTMRRQVVDAAARTLAEQAIAPRLEQADVLREQERHAEALKLIEKALIIRPDHPQAAAMKVVVKEVVERQK